MYGNSISNLKWDDCIRRVVIVIGTFQSIHCKTYDGIPVGADFD